MGCPEEEGDAMQGWVAVRERLRKKHPRHGSLTLSSSTHRKGHTHSPSSYSEIVFSKVGVLLQFLAEMSHGDICCSEITACREMF